MAMIFRADKGSVLSWAEGDANWQACMGVHNYLHVQHEVAPGAATGAFTSGAWRTRPLNTVVENNITGATVSSNQISLPAGTYLVSSGAIAYSVGMFQSRLQQISPSVVTLITGTMHYTHTAYGGEALGTVHGTFSLQSISVVELQMICSTTNSTYGFGGSNANFGQSTTPLAYIYIWKLS